MTTPMPFGLEVPTSDLIGQWVLRVLAVAGAAAVGGLTLGLVTQGLARLLTTRPVPRAPLNVIRLLGAVVCGWLVALLIFGGGLGGLGAGGGWSLFGGAGRGPGLGTDKEPPAAATGREGSTGRETGKASPAEGVTVQVEVLPRRDAYRVQTPGGDAHEFDFEQLTAFLLRLKKATPPISGVQVSPGQSDPSAPAVTRLTEWARRNDLNVVTPPSRAP